MWYLIFLALLFDISACQKCLRPDALITQTIENEGFHRDIKYLIEFSSNNVNILFSAHCKVALRQDIPLGLFVNPDQIADLVRVKKLLAYIDGNVNVETPMHHSEQHSTYIYSINDTFSRISLELPIHLRYQRAQITGGFGKVELPKPSLLVHCPEGAILCGSSQKVEAPCDYTGAKSCMWSNVSYKAITNDIEMMVPVGDLDHYPIVSIVTFLVACAGCIYILSVLSTTIL